MRYTSVCALLFVGLASLSAETTLQDARERWLRGNHEEAQEMYEELGKVAKNQPAAAIGLSRTLESQGVYDKAVTVLEPLLEKYSKNADLLARHAEILYRRGRWDEAEKSAEAAIEIDEQQFLARWVRAQLYRDRGDIRKADTEMRWFVKTYTQRSFNDDDIEDAEQLVLVGLAGTENARWHSISNQFKFILNDLYPDALSFDKSYWPAEYESGMLLLEKYNRPQALESFDKVLTINPSCAPALVGKGLLAMTKLEYDDAERFAEQALKINPRLPMALQLRADVHFAEGKIDAAMKELQTAYKVNPRDEQTLGRLAACQHMMKKEDEVAKYIEEVEKFDAKPAEFYTVLGEKLEGRRHYAPAEKYFQKAIDLRPMVPGPANNLGLLYMRMGREKEGAEVLTKAFEADRFNVRVSNMLKVLGHLKKYDTLETKHFHIRYDPMNDAVLARYLSEYLENIYEDLAKQFQYRPKGPILIEIFNNHQMFSGRTVALPDLHTIGACTGSMVTMVSPNGRGIREPFNWGRVMRHELVHVFNLEQTNFLVPHWFTEGLAVSNEGFDRPQTWNRLLKQRVPAGNLMTLDNIDLGFMRPRNPLDWNMAYCQSQLYVQYLKNTYTPESVGEMLAAFREGLGTAAAITKVCKVDKETFEKGYLAYLKKLTAELQTGPPEDRRTLKELQAEHEKNPADVDTTAALAAALVRRDRVQARKLAEEVRETKSNHPVACRVLARLALLGGDVKKQQELLEAGLDRKNPDPKVLLSLGKIYYDAEEYSKAADIYELGRKQEPTSIVWLAQLVKVYAQTGEKDQMIGILEKLVPMEADDLASRKRLARLLSEEDRHTEAEKYARQALEIDVTDEDSQNLLIESLRIQKKDDEAGRMRKLLTP